MIFTIFKTYRDVKKGVKDPTGLGKEMVLDVLKIPLVVFTIGGIIGLALFFILGWTELLVPSWGFFRFVFFFLLVPFTILEIIFWRLFSRAERLIEQAKQQADEKIKTINVEPN